MQNIQSLSHARWDCKYHLAIEKQFHIPKCRRKVLYTKLRPRLGEIFHQLASQRESTILEGHCCLDHVHMLIRIPPKILGRPSDRVCEGQECDHDCSGVHRA